MRRFKLIKLTQGHTGLPAESAHDSNIGKQLIQLLTRHTGFLTEPAHGSNNEK